MNINGTCPYETPCGWCSKWDKKCDKKIGNQTYLLYTDNRKGTKDNPYGWSVDNDTTAKENTND